MAVYILSGLFISNYVLSVSRNPLMSPRARPAERLRNCFLALTLAVRDCRRLTRGRLLEL